MKGRERVVSAGARGQLCGFKGGMTWSDEWSDGNVVKLGRG